MNQVPTGNNMELTFDDIHYSYSDCEKEALSGISLVFHTGERIALIGRNGCGKSTLMMHANGIKKPQIGEVRIDGKAVMYTRKGLLNLRRQVGLVFQNPEDQLFSASVFQDLSFGPMNMGLSKEEARQRIQKVAEICDLTGLMNRPTHALSGGEKTRAALAGVLAMEPKILFADEITNSLDPWMRQKILDIFSRLVEKGCTVVLASHDLELVRRWAQRVIWLEEGRIYREGSVREVLDNPKLPDYLEKEYGKNT